MEDGRMQVVDLFYGGFFILFIYSTFAYIWQPKLQWIITAILCVFWFAVVYFIDEKIPENKTKSSD